MKRFLAFAILLLSFNSFSESWDEENNPQHFTKIARAQMVTKLADLPLLGEVEDLRFGWSGSFWPSQKGGIAYRWNHEDPTPFRYKFHTYGELAEMTKEEMAKLSPAELYDIAQGDYKYTLTRAVLSRSRPHDLWWEGICHGWALASANYPEPAKVLVTNRDGLQISFGSSDVKALLSMHDAYNSFGTYARIGVRCNARGKVPGEAGIRDGHAPMPSAAEAESPECRDVNAGSFHIVLTNMIGLHGKGFVADIDRFADVWNQPVVRYTISLKEKSEPTEEELARGVATKIRVMTVMNYGAELQFFSDEAYARGERNFVSKEPITRTRHQSFKFKHYEYYLELNNEGHIIGGEWISLTRPDFIWTKSRDIQFNDGEFSLSGLKNIYHPINY